MKSERGNTLSILLSFLLFISCSSSHKAIPSKEIMVYRISNYWEETVLIDKGEEFIEWIRQHQDVKNISSLNVSINRKTRSALWSDFPPGSTNRPRYEILYAIHTFPDVFQPFKKLRKLTIFHMGMQSLPPSIGSLKHIWMLDISFNRISLFKSKSIFKKMKSLKVLRAYGCDWDQDTIDYLQNELQIEVRYTIEQYNEDTGVDRNSRSQLLRYGM
ncbi:MAG: hypothetical protein AAF206_16945 [Bacteroidota bacterium]